MKRTKESKRRPNERLLKLKTCVLVQFPQGDTVNFLARQTEKYKKSLQQHRDALNKLRTQAKAKRDEAEQQKQQDAQEIEALKSERDLLLSRIENELSPELQQLRTGLEQLQSEKTTLRQTIDDERAVHLSELANNKHDAMVILFHSCHFLDLDSRQSDLIAERDALAADKQELESTLEILSRKADEAGPLSEEERSALVSAREMALKESAVRTFLTQQS
jgi:prefoldin subunit 5